MPNITKEIQNTLKDLKQDESIMILLADKGRVSVVLDIDTNRSVPNSQQRPKNSLMSVSTCNEVAICRKIYTAKSELVIICQLGSIRPPWHTQS